MSRACHGFWKCDKTLTFCSLLTRCTIPCACHAKRHLTSEPPKVARACGVLYILTSKCASRHNGVHFSISHLARWLRTRRFSEPTFRPSGATNHWKTQCFAAFLPFRASASSSDSFSSIIFSLVFCSSLLPAPAQLCFPSVHIVRSLTSKLPSIIYIYICHIYIYKYVIYIYMWYIYIYICYICIYMQGAQWRKAKSMQAHSPKNGSASQRKPKERFKRCRDARAVLQQTWLPQAMPRHAYRQRQCTGPWAQPPAPPRYQSWLASALCKATPGKAARLAFASGNVDSWGAGPCLIMFARAYPHTSRGSSVKLAIRISLATKLLSMCSKATKHGVAFRIGLAAKLLRMRSKATKDDFAIRIGSAAKLLRTCFKE